MTILIATGLHKEAAILGGSGTVVVAGGGDGERLERELEVAAPGATAILSCGLAGALAPGLRAGDLIIGSLSPREKEGPHAEGMIDSMSSPVGRGNAALIDMLARHLRGAHLGTVVGSDTIIATAGGKHALHTETGALAVDMESHIAARVAARCGLPFAIVRAISDSADHTLPPAALVGMRPDGSVALGAVLASLARDPRQLPALIRTGSDAGRAFAALRRVRDVLRSLRVGLADDLQLALDMR